MIRDWVPARAWPLADALGAATGRSRFRAVRSWQEAVERTPGYGALVDDAHVGPGEWETGWPLATNREFHLLAAVGIVLGRLADTRTLRVLDVGGWSGVYSITVNKAYPHIDLKWTVLEIPAAHHRFQTVDAPPWISWETAFRDDATYDLVLASGSLNYIAEPIPTLHRLAAMAPFIVLTRLPLWPIPQHLPAVQYVDRRAGTGYPAWFFAESRFREDLDALGEILVEWSVPEDTAYFQHQRCDYSGLLLKSAAFGESST